MTTKLVRLNRRRLRLEPCRADIPKDMGKDITTCY